LSHAQFECYFKPYQEEHQQYYLSTDVDNPNVPNMKIVFKTFRGRDLILDTFGRDGFVIFRDDQDNKLDQYNTIPLPSITSVKETDVFKQIPINVIIDGVDVLNATNPNPKRLPNAIDAGQIANKSGKFSSESVIRKISSQKDGKIFYQDTNNSTNDFEVLNHPQVDIE